MIKMSTKDESAGVEVSPQTKTPAGETNPASTIPDIADTTQPTDTPNKKRHVIKAKHLKTAKLDGGIKNSPLSKSIGLIEKFRKQGKSKKQLNLKEPSSIATEKSESERNSDKESSNLQPIAAHDKEDPSPKKIQKQNNSNKKELQTNAIEIKSESVENISSKIQNSPKNTTKKKKSKKGNTKPTVKSHVLTEYYPVRRSSRKTKSLLQKEHEDFIIEAIKSNCEDGLEIVDFEAKGRGVIAKRAFKKGNFIVEYAGDLIDWNEAKKREDEYAIDPTIGCYMYYFIFDNTNYCIDATAESGRLGRLLNHSRKNPNCKTKLVSMPDNDSGDTAPRLVIVAKRDINAGEELTYDYGDRDKQTLQSHPWLKAT